MDNRLPTLRYGPNRAIGVVIAGAAVVVLGLALTTDDRLGRLLYLLAATALIGVSALDLIWNPRLVVDATGLTVRRPFGSLRIGWSAVDTVRVDERTRRGLVSHNLEIDAGDQLIILGRRALGGTDPREVAELIGALRP